MNIQEVEAKYINVVSKLEAGNILALKQINLHHITPVFNTVKELQFQKLSDREISYLYASNDAMIIFAYDNRKGNRGKMLPFKFNCTIVNEVVTITAFENNNSGMRKTLGTVYSDSYSNFSFNSFVTKIKDAIKVS